MKRAFLSFLPVAAMAMTLGLASCADSDNSPVEPEPTPNGGPFGGAVVDYNINDHEITVGSEVYEPITADNWRQQGSIFLYDGGNNANIKDTNGLTGYRQMNLPWAEGTVQSNLPVGFCHDIVPENGWEWVYNLCGSRSVKNGNFFAVYNKYSGILRFFFFMPEEFSAGNDHLWQVSMTDRLAQQSTWPYGVPEDMTIVDKAAIGQNGSGTYMEYVTPWVNYRSNDGCITPNAGWWAFDVDVSAYRPNENSQNDKITLQMRSWNTQHISLTSTISANIAGELEGKFNNVKTSVSSAKGLSESLGDIVGVGKDAYSAVSGAMSGDVVKTLSSAFSFAKGAYNVYGAMTKETEVSTDTLGKGTITGTITMALNGNIDTDGVIESSETVTGFSAVEIPMQAFDTEHSHFGQGTWNLKTTPVVYRMPYYISGHASHDNGASLALDWTYWWPYVFNPNSIEVELNPNLFPVNEIEWMQVDALCVARKNMNDMSNDNIRKAFGLQSCIKKDVDCRNFQSIPNYESANPVTNFVYAWEDNNLEVKQGNALINNVTEGQWDYGSAYLHTEILEGAGADDACIEPVYEWCAGYEDPGDIWRMPFLEVNVKVLVKMKGKDKPILLCRNYLPEFKDMDAAEFERSKQKAKPYADYMTGRNQLRDYQNQRIYDYSKEIYDDSFHKFVCTDGSNEYGATYEHSYSSLFDGDPATYWRALNAGGAFFVEFYARNPLLVTSYKLTTVNSDDGKYNPKSWKLYAKKSQNDNWTLIDERSGQQLPTTALNASETYKVSPKDTWQYFRFEVTELVQSGNYLWGTTLLQLAELELNSD